MCNEIVDGEVNWLFNVQHFVCLLRSELAV